ncbi:MAG: tyrosine-type recombinase/integrase [Chloroflexi bacterium]|uniref:tyrosine-type recombinase/integrase n=1 Tax=Candidatus Flexifilum breve TaxID=3140694 RepID=UPI00313561EF|nr:tyrosine-type recombinase/integrase [Chloroflexota bacterium]
MQIRDALQEFVEALIADRMKRNTAEWYMVMLQNNANSPITWLEAQQSDRLEAITVKTMRRYIVYYSECNNTRTGKPLSEQTINAMIRALHKWLRWCSVEYSIPNPMAGIAYPKRKRPNKRVELDNLIDSLRKMIAATEGSDTLSIRDRALLFLLIDSGMRAGGLVGMERSDLYLEQNCALIYEKGDQWRWVVFSAETNAALQSWLAIRDNTTKAVFHNLRTREPLTVSGLRSIIRSIARRAKVAERIYTHLMRKSFISLYTYSGGDVVTASRLSGHADVKTLMDHYVVYNARDLAQVHDQHSPLRFLLGKENAP